MCQSILYLKDTSASVTESECSNVILFTMNQKEQMSFLTKVSLYSAFLYSGCSSAITGKNRIKCYLKSLPHKGTTLVKQKLGCKLFKV